MHVTFKLCLITTQNHTLTHTHTSTHTHTILKACHNETVGSCPFGQDKVASKVSARYYWKTMNNDVADWVCYNVTAASRHEFNNFSITDYACDSCSLHFIVGKTL